MHCIKADFPSDWQLARVYVLADLHIGDPQCDYAECYKRVEQIKNDEQGLCILNGDIMNTALRNSVSDVYAEKIPPMKQVDEMVTMLKPIKHKIIGITTGNHEARTYKSDGLDITRFACRELGVEDKYAPEAVLIFLRFGQPAMAGKQKDSKQWYSIYATHGSGGGKREGSKIINLVDLATIVDADIYCINHFHLPIVTKEAYYRVSASQSSAKLVEKLFISTSAALNYGGYSQEKSYKPASKAMTTITLMAREKMATATL